MLHTQSVDADMELAGIMTSHVSPGCAAVAIFEDDASESGYGVVMTPELALLPIAVRLDALEAFADALQAACDDIRALRATGRL